jgi:hypothetical protein
MQRSFQLRQVFRAARRNNLHMAIFGIPNPPAQANLCRLSLHKPAKSDALNSAFDKVMAHHGSSSVAEQLTPRNIVKQEKRQNHPALPFLSSFSAYARLM